MKLYCSSNYIDSKFAKFAGKPIWVKCTARLTNSNFKMLMWLHILEINGTKIKFILNSPVDSYGADIKGTIRDDSSIILECRDHSLAIYTIYEPEEYLSDDEMREMLDDDEGREYLFFT